MPVMLAPSHVGPLAKYQARSHGGGGGGLSPPGQIWAPLGCLSLLPVPFGIEVYPPPRNSVSPSC